MPEYSDYIEGLTAASALDGSEIIGLSQGGSAKRTTTEDIADLIGNPSFGGAHTFTGAGTFPTASIAGKLYIATNDHGVPGDADYVSSGSWMLSKIAGANEFSEYYIKP